MPHNPETSDPAVDANLSDDQAIYEERAAIAAEPAPPATEPSHGRSGPAPASFDTIAATLTKMQVAAAAHPGSILVLAGAETGKTSTLTAAVAHRIAVDRIPPHRVLAVTLTNKAAHEMAMRIRTALGVDAALCWLGAFHGLAARQLRASPEVAHLRENFDILDADDARRILRRVMKALNLSTDEDESGKRASVSIRFDRPGHFRLRAARRNHERIRDS
jgi:DNA helicase-2/ATP-dependent DNA helicase PcrA